MVFIRYFLQLTVFSISIFAESANSAPLIVDRLGLQQGLSQSTVYSIVQSHDGYIWIATTDGLDIYDGYEIRHLQHNPDDPFSLSGNYIYSLLVSKDGSIWIGTLGAGLNRYDPATKKMDHFLASNSKNSLLSNDVYSLYQSTNGLIWVGSELGVSAYDPASKSFINFTHKPGDSSSLVKGRIRAITQTQNGDLWFGSSKYGLSRLNAKTEKFTQYQFSAENENSISDNSINTIYRAHDNSVWIGTEFNGLNRLDLETDQITRFVSQPGKATTLPDKEVTTIFEDKNGLLWLGTWSSGLVSYDRESGKFKSHRMSQVNVDSLSSDTVVSLFQDRSGVLWAGTYDNGVNRINLAGNDFDHFKYDPISRDGPAYKMIWAFAEDKNSNIWVGTKKGLSLLDTSNDEFTSYPSKGNCQHQMAALDVRTILVENDILWIGTFGGGLIKFNPESCDIRSYVNDENDPVSISNNQVRLLMMDAQKQLWIGTSDGLNRLDTKTEIITRYIPNKADESALPHSRIRALFEDMDGNILIGSSGGLSFYQPESNSFINITSKDGLLSENDVRSLYQDKQGALWIATGLGLTRYDKKLNKSEFFYKNDGLANDTLYGLLPDGENLWITTNNGLSRFNRKTKKVKNYRINDGLQSNEFNFNAYLKTKSGDFYIGGVNGFNRFNPGKFVTNNSPPELVVMAEVIDENNEKRISQIKSETKPLILKASDKKLIYTIEVLHFQNPLKNTFKYRLVGYESDWILRKGKNKVIEYAGLPVGDYQFEIRAFNSSGVSGNATIKQSIHIEPLFWKTVWAYSLYALLIIASFYVLLHFRTLKLKQNAKILDGLIKNKTLELQQKNEKINSVLKNQDEFYIRTAHELRTPLTIINTTADLLNQNNEATEKDTSVDIIQRAANRLQQVIDQMLQAARSGKTHEKGAQTIDLVAVIYPLIQIYAKQAKVSGIVFNMSPLPVAAVTVNRKLLEDIIHNLLSNAVKYTQAGGKIAVSVLLQDGALIISIKDTGIGIDEKNHERIFMQNFRTNQAKEIDPQGKGIGLYTVKSQVEACNGTMQLISNSGEGSEFIVSIPAQWIQNETFIDSEDNKVQELLRDNSNSKLTNQINRNTKKLLIIEDDRDLQQVLELSLRDDYWVKIAGNIEEARQSVNDEHPDIIICDVMLPDGNGFDLTQALKNNIETSHIPIILLTAVGDLISKKEGWRSGADDYIIKPFAQDELNLRIQSLLENRQRLKLWYQGKLVDKQDNFQVIESFNRKELEYINKLETNTLALLKQRRCQLDTLAESMGQSSRTLQRIINDKFACSYTKYVQAIQLKMAHQLLSDGLSIKQAAYESGFNDASYFSKLFKAQYGFSPSKIK